MKMLLVQCKFSKAPGITALNICNSSVFFISSKGLCTSCVKEHI
ncbi:Protein of unknown function [Gryllus bimaculatus]|nr:Protein of unknown function [Gryllus bimaculatus]